MDYDEDFEEETSQSSEGELRKGSVVVDKAPRKRGKAMLLHSEIPHVNTSHARSTNPSTDRIVSSKNRAIHALQNHLAVVQRELDGALLENKLLKRVHHRQERELARINRSEGQLPQILFQHSEEVRALKEHLTKSRKVNGDLQKRVAELGNELVKTKEKAKKLEVVVRRKGLLDRETLTFELQETKDTIGARDRQIMNLQRELELINKNHAQEVKSLHLRQKELLKQLQSSREEGNLAKRRLKEKGKELDVMNIYSQRLNVSIPSKSFTESSPSPPPQPLKTSSACQTKETLSPREPGSLRVDRQTQECGIQTERAKEAKPATPAEMKVEKAPSSKSRLGTVPSQALGASSRSDTGPAPSQGSGQFPKPTPSNRFVPSSVPAPSQGSGPFPNPTLTNHTIPPQNPAPVASGARPLSAGTNAENDAVLAEGSKPRTHHYPSTSETTPASSSAEPGEASKTISKLLDEGTDRQPRQSLETRRAETVAEEIKSKPDITEILFGNQPPRPSQHFKSTASNQSGASPNWSSKTQLDPEKKKQLLAKLMESDSAQNPPAKIATSGAVSSYSTLTDKNSAKHEHPEPKPGQDVLAGNGVSQLSLEEKIENMHKGRPSFSTEDDPYGTKHMSVAGSQTSITTSPLAQRPKHGRRAEQATADAGGFKVLADEPTGYQPSFGRRAGANRSFGTNSTLAGTDGRSDSEQVKLKESTLPEKAREKLDIFESDAPLQRSSQPQVYPWEKKINVSRTGIVTTLGDTDDIEELAL